MLFVATALFALVASPAAASAHIRPFGNKRHRTTRMAVSQNTVSIQERDSCTLGSWKCVGSELQRCYNDQWNVVQNCTGDSVVCSDDPTATGCIFTWQVPSADSETSTTAENNDDSPTGSVDEISDLTTTISTYAAATVETTATYSDMSDNTYVTSSSISSDSTTIATDFTVTAANTAPTVATTAIGVNLNAGSETTTSRKGKHNGSTSTGFYSVSAAAQATQSTFTASAADIDTTQFGTSDTVTGYTESEVESTSSTLPEPTSTTTTKKSKSKATSVNASVPGTNTAAATTSAGSSSGNSTSSGSSTSWEAPHYVIYADNWLSSMPSASDVGSYNRFVLSFWMASSGAVDDAQMWAELDADTRSSVLEEYHAAGIALMVSAFGSTDAPTTDGKDPTDTAQELATFVKEYGFDGVDIDYEDFGAFDGNTAEAWINTFQTELRDQLGSSYLISHAPVAPWFTSASIYAGGGYVAIHDSVGDTIDWYNIQFYNQGSDMYTDCTSLISNSGSSWPSTSVLEINSYAGVPLDKIVIGKPLTEDAASNGYMDPSTLATCVAQAQASGWNAGNMWWEWGSTAPSVLSTLLAGI